MAIIAGAVAAGIALIGPGAGSSEAAKKRVGTVAVGAKITLRFPARGTYAGEVKPGKVGIRKIAKVRGELAGRSARGFARDEAKRVCGPRQRNPPFVQVHHLSRPPFLLGEDTPDGRGRYRVKVGAKPPTGDPVRALIRFRRSRSSFQLGDFDWIAVCLDDRVVKPYPF